MRSFVGARRALLSVVTTTSKANAEIANFVSLANDPTMLPSMPGLNGKRRAGGWMALAAAVVALVRIGF